MNYETNILTSDDDRIAETSRLTPAPFLPAGTVMGERAAGWLRAYLERNGLDDYQIYCSNDFDLHDVDEHLEALGAGDDASAAWEAVEPLSAGGKQPAYLSGRRGEKAFPAGVLHLRAHRAVIGRWYWFDTDEGAWYAFRLLATPAAEQYAKLREVVRDLRRRTATASWRVVSGEPWKDGEKLSRDEGGFDALILSEALRARLEADVVGFFSERAAGLYARLGVSYRRGVLLYGPPGNGKTSIIRALSAKLPAVSGFVLRATGSLDDDDFATVVKRWTGAAPAILVIEDLNWLFPNRVTVSTFLNLIDGLETPRAGGLMLVASTNHPETLDPALSDRPGRFDVTVEVPSPGREMRGAFFRRALGGGTDGAAGAGRADLPGEAVMGKLVRETAGLSFAHLREVVQAAGLAAIRAGREARTDEDLLAAAEAVVRAHRAAGHGFPVMSEEPFGLAQWRSTRVDERQGECGCGSDSSVRR